MLSLHAAFLSGQASSRHLLEDRNRGGLPIHLLCWIDKERLFQCILPAQNRVRYRLGVDHPTRAWGELNFFAYTARLECRVFFHGVMQAHHELIVRPPFPLRNECRKSRRLRQLFPGAHDRTGGVRDGELTRSESADNAGKRLADDPVACSRRMNVVKEPQDAPALRRSRRKCVRVKQVITPSYGQIAALLFQWTEARVIESPSFLVWNKEAREEIFDALGVASHHLMHAGDLSWSRRFLIHAAQLVAIWLVGDVLVQGARGLLLSEQKGQIVRRN